MTNIDVDALSEKAEGQSNESKFSSSLDENIVTNEKRRNNAQTDTVVTVFELLQRILKSKILLYLLLFIAFIFVLVGAYSLIVFSFGIVIGYNAGTTIFSFGGQAIPTVMPLETAESIFTAIVSVFIGFVSARVAKK